MLLPLEGRRLYYDLTGPENGPVVCMTHSLMSDSGMWSEQMPTLLQAGFRVLRLDMRGHGGSDPGAGGDYTMQGIADDWAAALEALNLPRVHYIGLSIGGQSGQVPQRAPRIRLDCRRVRSRCPPQRRRVLRGRRRLPRGWPANDRLPAESTIPLRDSPRWTNLEARFEAFPRPSCRDGQMPDCDAKGYCRSVEERALSERIALHVQVLSVSPWCPAWLPVA